MEIIEIGRSELPGRTFGVMQTMEARAGRQVLGLIREVERVSGYRLTPNEGRRSRLDQRLVWNAYALFLAGRGPWAPRAAACYTSIHDEINHGNAVDFGGPGGEVIPQHVHDVMVSLRYRFGVVWTGAGFGEWWHFEVDLTAASEIMPADTTLDTIGTTTPVVVPPVIIKQKEEDMVYIGKLPDGSGWVVDDGSRTRWNVAKGLKKQQDVFTRMSNMRKRGVEIHDISTLDITAYRDITNNNSREYL